MIRMKKIRDSARNQPCTINAPCCNFNPETTVLAHYHAPGHGTMGGKSDDSSAAYACSACHDFLDRRTHLEHSFPNDPDREWYWFRGCLKTWKLLLENEVLT